MAPEDRRICRRDNGPPAPVLHTEIHELNGQPALVFYDEDCAIRSAPLGVADGRIHAFFPRGCRAPALLGRETARRDRRQAPAPYAGAASRSRWRQRQTV